MTDPSSTDDQPEQAPRGIQRRRPDQLHTNHHGDQVAPLTAAGNSYALCWTDPSTGDLVFAETAEDLLAYWIDGYRDADTGGRAALRARHAVTVQAQLAAQLVADADQAGSPATPREEAVLLADLDQLPDLISWDSPVPLVLLEGMYRPFTDRVPPISGIDGDVKEPSNIIWLRNAHPAAYLQSLARAGVVQLDISHDH